MSDRAGVARAPIAFCAAPGVGGGGPASVGDFFGVPSAGEFMVLGLLVAVLVGAGAWMFRRFGRRPDADMPPITPPEAETGGRARPDGRRRSARRRPHPAVS